MYSKIAQIAVQPSQRPGVLLYGLSSRLCRANMQTGAVQHNGAHLVMSLHTSGGG